MKKEIISYLSVFICFFSFFLIVSLDNNNFISLDSDTYMRLAIIKYNAIHHLWFNTILPHAFWYPSNGIAWSFPYMFLLKIEYILIHLFFPNNITKSVLIIKYLDPIIQNILFFCSFQYLLHVLKLNKVKYIYYFLILYPAFYSYGLLGDVIHHLWTISLLMFISARFYLNKDKLFVLGFLLSLVLLDTTTNKIFYFFITGYLFLNMDRKNMLILYFYTFLYSILWFMVHPVYRFSMQFFSLEDLSIILLTIILLVFYNIKKMNDIFFFLGFSPLSLFFIDFIIKNHKYPYFYLFFSHIRELESLLYFNFFIFFLYSLCILFCFLSAKKMNNNKNKFYFFAVFFALATLTAIHIRILDYLFIFSLFSFAYYLSFREDNAHKGFLLGSTISLFFVVLMFSFHNPLSHDTKKKQGPDCAITQKNLNFMKTLKEKDAVVFINYSPYFNFENQAKTIAGGYTTNRKSINLIMDIFKHNIHYDEKNFNNVFKHKPIIIGCYNPKHINKDFELMNSLVKNKKYKIINSINGITYIKKN